jgi:hydrogenase nickel incorporation protein HypA/HybF
MHELPITASLVDAVCERVGRSKVARVRIAIGKLSGVMPDSLRFCFEACTTGTVVEGAHLEVDEIPARIQCHECHEITDIDDAIPLCRCGSVHLDIVSGRELKITEVEVI